MPGRGPGRVVVAGGAGEERWAFTAQACAEDGRWWSGPGAVGLWRLVEGLIEKTAETVPSVQIEFPLREADSGCWGFLSPPWGPTKRTETLRKCSWWLFGRIWLEGGHVRAFWSPGRCPYRTSALWGLGEAQAGLTLISHAGVLAPQAQTLLYAVKKPGLWTLRAVEFGDTLWSSLLLFLWLLMAWS